MVSKEEIKKLATLARMQIEEGEIERLAPELDAILSYVSQIDKALETVETPTILRSENIFREDVVTTKEGEYTKDLLALSPQSEKGFVKVKKIL